MVEADFPMNINQTKGDECPPKERELRANAKNLTGPQIRLFREKRGWTQHQLAKSFQKAGVPITRDIIASIETQRCSMTDCQIILFSRILGVSWKSLFPDKAVLDAFAPPPSALTSQPEPNPHTHQAKNLARNPSVKPSRQNWKICEMVCKSLKITFREPS